MKPRVKTDKTEALRKMESKSNDYDMLEVSLSARNLVGGEAMRSLFFETAWRFFLQKNKIYYDNMKKK